MHREHVRPVLLITASIIAGTVAWSGHVLLLPLACTFPILWGFARTRLTAALVSAGYFLAASRGLPQGVATFYSSDLWPGLL
ncbi:conjugal transfer protein TraB, partial [Rhizobium sp. BR 317]